MRKSFKYRLFPTKAQVTLLEQTLDACRFVYNQSLAHEKSVYETEKRYANAIELRNLLPLWKEQHPFLDVAHSQLLQEAQGRVDLAYKAFFRRVKAGETPGYPRFRGKDRYDSFTYPQSGFKIVDDKLRLSKIGDVSINLHRPVEGTVKTLTIIRNSLGKFYACFSCVVEPKLLPHLDNSVGIDMGLQHFMYLSDRSHVKNPRFFKQDKDDLARAQRALSKQEKGTKARFKKRRVVQHIYERTKNRRTNFAHQISRDIVNRYGIICVEDLNVKGLLEKFDRANAVAIHRSIADAAWAQSLGFIAYKAEEAGRINPKVNARGTSQECSGCGKIVQKTLETRTHHCPYCGLKIPRDFNSSIIIERRGLASLGAPCGAS